MWTSPLGTTILLIGIGFYFPKPIVSYIMMLFMDFLNTVLLFSNVLYYRQFSDFITVKTITNATKVAPGLGKSAVALLHPSDILIWLDLIVIIILLVTKKIRIDPKSYGMSTPFAITSLGAFLLGLNMFLAESSRPRLLRNTFDRSYVVKYLGLDTYTVYDGIKNAQTVQVTKNANSSDLNKILTYTKKHYAKPNSVTFGKEKGKNVIIIHLESFQQFLINLKVNGKEVTPFLNSIYRNQHTISFNNFYHQVGLGRTSDAENMLETSTYGISDGSLFTSLGSENTFQAAPQILRQDGYTSAVFHGNVGTFWNRNEVYKNMGYNYFFDQNYFSNASKDKIGYGLKDKIFFDQSIKYIEKLPQPFYLKMITVTNHYPYQIDKKNQTISKTDTNDETVDGYVQTAHYLDQAIGELMKWMHKTGLDKNTLIMFYGDHYGISGNHHKASAQLLKKESFNDFDNLQFQRVPLMFHMKGLKGKIDPTYGGEIDVLPTLLNLLGIKNQDTIQFGHDLLSKNAPQLVAQRNGDFITPEYAKVSGSYYYTKTGKKIVDPDKKLRTKLSSLSNQVTTQLSLSDRVIDGNLLRFYKPVWFEKVKPSDYDYNKEVALKKLDSSSNKTSLWYKNHKKTTQSKFKTDEPELKNKSAK